MRLGLLPGTVRAAGGPSTYLRELVAGLREHVPEWQVQALLLGARSTGRSARDAARETLGMPVVARPVSARLYNSTARRLLPSYPRLFGPHDVFHQTHLDVRPAVPAGRLVVTLHDLVAVDWPDEGVLLPSAGDVLGEAAAVITVSAASREAILLRFPHLDPARVRVVHNGVDHSRFTAGPAPGDEAVLRRYGLTRHGFVLYAGGLTRRKNVEVLLRAHEASTAGPLVLIGPWQTDDPRVANSRAQGLGQVPPAHVAPLMRQAKAVVVPSRAEGFGLPVLEALACGAPVVCSDIPVFREIGGPAVELVDTREPGPLAAALSEVRRDDRRIDAGREHAAGFTWARSAREHAGVYGEVVAALRRRPNRGARDRLL